MDFRKILGDEGEKPLDTLLSGSGFVPIFQKLAVVGDSIASGELQINTASGNHYFDFYEYSWGKYIEKITGVSTSVFAKGGMTARAFRNQFANAMGFWKQEKAANGYIIALGVNDLINGDIAIGDISDICDSDPSKNADTYIGNYAYIIQRYKTIQPEAKFFLLTIPKSSDRGEARLKKTEAQRAAIYKLAEYFDNCYVIDLFENAPDFDAFTRDNFFLNGHMSPAGYLMIARLVITYIDYIIRHNMQDFKYVGLMGVDKNN